MHPRINEAMKAHRLLRILRLCDSAPFGVLARHQRHEATRPFALGRQPLAAVLGEVVVGLELEEHLHLIEQGGTRRGANMGILRVDHPDIRSFIACKNDTTQITNFNISVAITDTFMDAVSTGESYDLVNPRDGEVIGQENAREIFDMIIHGAWLTGEPGTFFIDRANEYNPVPKMGSYEATNPWG